MNVIKSIDKTTKDVGKDIDKNTNDVIKVCLEFYEARLHVVVCV